MKVFDSTVAAKSRRAMTKAERTKRIIAASPAPIAAAAALPAMATKASCRPGRSIASVSIPAPPSISALSKGSGPPSGSSNTHSSPSRRAPAGMAERHGPSSARVRRRTIGRSLARASSTRPSNATLPLAMIAIRSHSRSAWAMTWVEKMIVAPVARLAADQLLEPRLVDRVEPGERLVEDDQPRLVDDRAEQLDGLRHAFGQGADRLFRPVAKVVLGEQGVGAAPAFGQRQAAQRAHEGDRLARMHRRIEAALLGQIADLAARIERPLAAEHAPAAARRIDDPEQHPQRRRLARAVGAEQAVDGAGGDGEADAVDRAGLAEILDEIDALRPRSPFVAELVEALFFLKH